MFKIEKNIPFGRASTKDEYPFDQMEVGDSILVRTNIDRARQAASKCGMSTYKRFKSRAVDGGGVRIWRVE